MDPLPPIPFPPKMSSSDIPKKSRKSKDSTRDSKRLSRSTREVVRLLLDEERESNDLQRTLLQVTEQMRVEKQRADDAERLAKDAVARMKTLNDARVAAQQNASRANRELQLYKIQLDAAQNEILKAQKFLDTLEAQKNQAEAEAARARTTARQLRQEKVIALAREEGRRLGLQEGLERGRELGYQQGRVTGYAHGRSSAEHELEQEEEYSPEGPEEYLPDPVSEIPPQPPVPPAEIAIHPPVTAAPRPQVDPVPRPVERDQIRPNIVHNVAPSPRHVPVDIPPDNWIPRSDEDLRIRLPPPHELSRLPQSPVLSSPHLPPLPVEEPALMIPAPITHRPESAGSIPRSDSSTPRYRRGRRHSSPESSSTTISQLDMLSAPTHYQAQANASSPLSVIPEVLSVQTSPHHTTTSEGSLGPSRNGSLSNILHITTPTPHSAVPNISNLEDGARRHERYRRGSPSSDSSDSSMAKSQLRSQRFQDRRESSSSTSTAIGITIEPPSRPHSNTSLNPDSTTRPFGGFLSPADANRPVPLPDRRDTPTGPPMMAPASSGSPIILPNDQLPLGFVPTGPFTPLPMSMPLSGVASPVNTFGGGIPGSFGTPTVEPNLNGLGTGGRTSRNSQHSGRSTRRDDIVIPIPLGPVDSDDEASSSSSSRETLTTPPPGSNGRSRSNAPLHEAEVAPVEEPQPIEVPTRVQPTASRGNNRRRGRGRR